MIRLTLVLVIALAFMFSDGRFQWIEDLKSGLLSGLRPVYEAADLPQLAGDWAQKKLTSKDEMYIELTRLESENIVLRAKLQKMTTLAIENVRLRELLNANHSFEENVLVAEIISVSPDPVSHHVILNKGAKHGLYIGQAVVDAYGLFGQIVQVGQSVATVLLISDERQSVPVQVNRNGARFIAEGTNHFSQLRLPHVPITADLKEGDVLSTSGLGQLYPIGYPVARVKKVEHLDGEMFSRVDIEPFAALNQSRHVLLLFSNERQQIAQPVEEQKAALTEQEDNEETLEEAGQTEDSTDSPISEPLLEKAKGE